MGGRGVSPWQSAKTLKVDGLKRAQTINMSVKQEDYQIWTNGYTPSLYLLLRASCVEKAEKVRLPKPQVAWGLEAPPLNKAILHPSNSPAPLR